LITSENLAGDEHRLYEKEIAVLAESLIEEIQHHRKLMLAERGELLIDRKTRLLSEILRAAEQTYRAHPAARNRILRLLPSADALLETDVVLLKRVIGNLINNALEATAEGGIVSFWAEKADGNVRIQVQNDGVIPRETQLQIFQRSFTTKPGSGRGLGTYSVKLFTEKFLNGKVEFTSDAAHGTTFCVTIPLQHAPPATRR
jgi:signal transduction histidine kinase